MGGGIIEPVYLASIRCKRRDSQKYPKLKKTLLTLPHKKPYLHEEKGMFHLD